MNRLFYIGPLYWILRDNGKKGDKVLGWGFMRQTSPPWKVGRGPHIRVGRYAFQFGLARKTGVKTEEDGLLMSIQGRFLDTKPGDIRDWA